MNMKMAVAVARAAAAITVIAALLSHNIVDS